MSLQGLGGTHGWAEVCCIAAEKVVASRYAAVEDKDGDLDSMVAEGIGDVAAVVQGHCYAVGPDRIHLRLEGGGRSAVVPRGKAFVSTLLLKPGKSRNSVNSLSKIFQEEEELCLRSWSEFFQVAERRQRYLRRRHLFDKGTRDHNCLAECSCLVEHNLPFLLNLVCLVDS